MTVAPAAMAFDQAPWSAHTRSAAPCRGSRESRPRRRSTARWLVRPRARLHGSLLAATPEALGCRLEPLFYPPGVATAEGRAFARLRFGPDWREAVEGELVAGGLLAIEYA